jgi:TolB-like protein/Tfp pilus assembly protein PilF
MLPLAIIAVAVVGMIAGAGYYFMHRAPTAIDSVAVLPLANGTSNSEMDYLADGITEGVINHLSRLSGLRVMARSTVFRYRQAQQDPIQIGRDLKVGAVVVGRLSQHGDTVNIETEMVNVSNGTQIWGEQYRRKASEIATVQDDIASDISGQLGLKLTGEERKKVAEHGTVNSQAYQNYVKGQFYLEKRTRDDFYRAIDEFNQAIAKDPSYAQAYAGLAFAYVLLLDREIISTNEAAPKIRSAAQKAIDLDPTLSEPHVILGELKEEAEWDWAAAEAEYRKAIETNPNDALTHHFYAVLLDNLGRLPESLAETQKSLSLDPGSLQTYGNEVGVLIEMHRYDDALNESNRLIAANPDFPPFYGGRSSLYWREGNYDAAIADELKAMRLGGRKDLADAMADGYRRGKIRGAFTSAIELLKQKSATEYISPYEIALNYAAVGDRDQTFAWLEKAYQQRSGRMEYIKTEDFLEPYHSDPRYQDLLKRMGLPQ